MILVYPPSLQKLPEHVGTKEENPLEQEDKTNPLVIPGWVKLIISGWVKLVIHGRVKFTEI